MKNVLLLLAFIFSTTLFSQNKFDGKWVYEPSDYILNIETNKNKLYIYNPKTNDTVYESIVYQNEKEIMARITATDGIYYTKYKFINNELNCIFQENNYKIIYKKQ
jgi:hypothetical protein